MLQVKVATLEGTPEGVVAPTILVESAYSMVISWLSPSEPNGFITSYSLYLISDEDEEIYKGSEKSYQLTGECLSLLQISVLIILTKYDNK